MPFFFFFNDTATTEIYTLSLHDALPIFIGTEDGRIAAAIKRLKLKYNFEMAGPLPGDTMVFEQSTRHDLLIYLFHDQDRKSTRLNSSHANISYAVFCLKKKKKHEGA